MRGAPRSPSDRPPWAWRLVVGAVLWLLRDVLGWRVRAQQPAVIPPRDQPLLVVFNHTSLIDALLVADTVWRRLGRWCQPLVKTELFDVPLFGLLVRRAGAIPVMRTEEAGREAAYDAAVARLGAGATILIAPEGTTTHDGSLLPLRHGAARLALEAGVDVLVVTHFGAQRAFSPVVRFPQRGAVVTMSMDVLRPRFDEDASSLSGRIAATMLDRSDELRATYPQPDPDARWWPPYSSPASPTATARENVERYRQSMAEAVLHARARMAQISEEHEIDQRMAQTRERAVALGEELATRSRARAEMVTEQARARAEMVTEQARARAEMVTEQARDRFEEVTEHARDRFEEVAAQTRQRATTLGDRLGKSDAQQREQTETTEQPEQIEESRQPAGDDGSAPSDGESSRGERTT